jgi:hypothetical protein
LPHDPQLLLSLWVLAQKGAPPSGVQSTWTPLHVDLHWRLMQICCAPHFAPHEPQFALSDARFAQ